MKSKIYFSLSLFLFLFITIKAQVKKDRLQNKSVSRETTIVNKDQKSINKASTGFIHIANKNWYFEEYKSQVHNPEACTGLKYIGKGNNFRILCAVDKITIQLQSIRNETQVSEASGSAANNLMNSKYQNHDNDILSTQSIELAFEGCRKNCQIIAQDQQDVVYNYNFNQNQPGISGIHTYKKLIYKDLYPHIDLVLYSLEKGLKYEFHVNPGGKVSDIKLRWNGTGNFVLKDNGSLCLKNNVGMVWDSRPVSYQGNNIISTLFEKQGNLITFKTGSYDADKVLVIDPVINWATYIGGTGEDKGLGISVDKTGNIYATGQTASTSSIASGGSYQTSYGGGAWDAYLSKFSSNGKLLWTTYFGGTDQDISYCTAADSNGYVYISGTSLSNGMSTSGAYQTSNNGNGDAFLAKFSSTGALVWSTYYGGSSQDLTVAIAIDSKLNVIISGVTYSASNVATSGAYQTSNYGNSDAFLAKFSSAGSLQWSTLFGGTGQDRGWGLGVDSIDDIFMTGPTQSTSNIATSGAYQTSYGGDIWDSYIAKFSSTGAIQWSTFYGGNGQDAIFALAMDHKGNPVVTGYTWSTSQIATSGTYQTSNTGVSDAFITKFSNSGALLWGSYEGGSSYDIGLAITMDQNNNFLLTGFTQSSTGFASTGAFQSSYSGGNGDGWVSKFTNNGKRIWSTYYGGSGNEQGMGIVTYKGYVYVTGFTASSSSIATSGSYHSSYGGGNNDAFLLKIQDSCFHHTVVLTGDKSACYSTNSTYYSNSFSGSQYKWTVNGGTILSSTTDTVVVIKWNKVTKGYLKITHTNILGCTDTASLNISIDTFNTNYFYNKTCFNDSTQFTASMKNYTRTWYFGDGNTSTQLNPLHVYPKPGIYTVKLVASDSTGCKDSISKVVTIYAMPAATVGKSTAICLGDSINLGTAPVSGDIYSWTSNPSSFISASSSFFAKPTVNTIYYLTEKNSGGCSKSDSVLITVNTLPNAIVGKATTICEGDSVTLGGTAVSGNSYAWISNPSGFTSSLAQVTVRPAITTVYSLKEVIISTTGCSKINSVKITVNPLPNTNPGIPQTICAGQSATIGSTGVKGFSYSWSSSPSGFSSALANPSVSPSITTNYYLIVKNDSTGCKKKDSVLVIANKLPDAITGSPQTICYGDTTTVGFNPTTGHSYSWSSIPSGFGSSQSNPKISPKSTTTYYLTETITSTGCQKSNSVNILVLSLPNPHFTSKQNYSLRLNLKAVDTTLTSYKWSFGDGQTAAKFATMHDFKTDNTYDINLKVTDKNGCSAVYDSIIHATYSGISNSGDNDLTMTLYPNPFDKKATIEYSIGHISRISISLINMMGQEYIILPESIHSQGKYQVALQPEKFQLTPGLYLLKFNLNDQPITRTVIKL
jgi:hypothetical protein